MRRINIYKHIQLLSNIFARMISIQTASEKLLVLAPCILTRADNSDWVRKAKMLSLMGYKQSDK